MLRPKPKPLRARQSPGASDMATLRETIQAEIDALKAKVDVLKAKLQNADPAVQSVLGKEYSELQVLVTTFKDQFP